jgi:hypothetical protein
MRPSCGERLGFLDALLRPQISGDAASSSIVSVCCLFEGGVELRLVGTCTLSMLYAGLLTFLQ